MHKLLNYSAVGLLCLLSPFQTRSADCVSPPADLVSWWQAESNANDVLDGNHGTFTNGAGTSVGQVGQAFDFNGVNQFVIVPSSSSLNPAASFSIEGWIYPRQDRLQSIMSKWTDWEGERNQRSYALVADANRVLVFAISDWDHQWDVPFHHFVTTNNVFDLNTWSHVAAVYDQAAGARRIYVNGVKVAERIDPPITVTNSTAKVGIGAQFAAEPEYFFDGLIDELSFYARALSGAEIEAIYNAGSAGKCVPPYCIPPPSGLVGWWAGEGNALDSIGASHGVLQNGTGFAPGEVGQAFNFTGGSGYVQVPAGSKWALGTRDFSIELWVRFVSLGGSRPFVACDEGGGTVNKWIFWLNNGQLQLHLYGSGIGVVYLGSGSFSPVINRWHHVAVTRSGSLFSFYVDGVLNSTATSSVVIPTANAPLTIGQAENLFFMGGYEDEVAIYSRALSAGEIQGIYGAASAGKCGIGPAILTQPQGQSVVVGAAVNLSVVASGTPPLLYQWACNGTNMAGASTSALMLTNVQTSNEGSYAVMVSNAYGWTNSSTAILVVNPPLPCANPPSGLLGWWAGEGTGSDSYGTNDGALQGGMSFVPGQVGQAFSFNGTNANVVVAASSSLNVGPGSGLTIEAWIKPADVSVSQPLVEWNGGYFDAHFWISVQSAGSLYANLVDTSRNYHVFASAGGLLTQGSYQHVALTYDQSSGMGTFLVNGSVVTQQNLGSFTPETEHALYFGLRPSGGTVTRFAGQMDEVSVYARALSAAEIQAIYDAGCAGKCLPAVAPAITTQPQSQTVGVGANAVFSVVAAGTVPLSYQWRFDGTNLSGAVASSLTLTNAQVANSGTYSVVVTNAYGWVASSNALLTVIVPVCVSAPTNLVSWWRGEGDASDTVGTNSGTLQGGVTFGGGEVGRAFSFDGSSGLVSIPASASLNVGAGNGLTVECWINPGDTAMRPLIEWNNGASYGVHLWMSVDPPPGYGSGSLFANLHDIGNHDHWISSPPGIVSAGNWQHVALTYDKIAGVAELYYNGTVVAAQTMGSFTPQTGSNLLLGRRPSNDLPAYYYGLLDEVSVYSRALSATEIAALYNAASAGKCFAPVPPSIVTEPQSRTVMSGMNASFSVVAAGTPPLNYQWQFNGTNLAGANSTTLTLTNVQLAQAGSYAVRVTNLYGATISSNAVLILLRPPVITRQPRSLAAVPGGSASFSVSAQGLTPLSFQWQRNGEALAGQTKALLAITNVQSPDFATYTVGISNADGAVLSDTAILTLAVSPVITSVGYNLETFMLTVPTEVGPTYVVEYKDSLDDPTWKVLTTVAGTGSPIPITDNGLTSTVRFYRVRVR